MTIDWLHFTPWPALAGGALIGLAAALFVPQSGAGCNGFIFRSGGETGYRVQTVCRAGQAGHVLLLPADLESGFCIPLEHQIAVPVEVRGLPAQSSQPPQLLSDGPLKHRLDCHI